MRGGEDEGRDEAFKGCMNVITSQGADLEGLGTYTLGHGLDVSRRHARRRGALEVRLGADNDFADRSPRVSLDLLVPAADVCEALLVSHVIDEYDTMGRPVEAAGDGTKALLATSVPEIDLDALATPFALDAL